VAKPSAASQSAASQPAPGAASQSGTGATREVVVEGVFLPACALASAASQSAVSQLLAVSQSAVSQLLAVSRSAASQLPAAVDVTPVAAIVARLRPLKVAVAVVALLPQRRPRKKPLQPRLPRLLPTPKPDPSFSDR